MSICCAVDNVCNRIKCRDQSIEVFCEGEAVYDECAEYPTKPLISQGVYNVIVVRDAGDMKEVSAGKTKHLDVCVEVCVLFCTKQGCPDYFMPDISCHGKRYIVRYEGCDYEANSEEFEWEKDGDCVVLYGNFRKRC